MNPEAFNYNFGFKDPVFYDFVTSYLRVPGFNTAADIASERVFEIKCGKNSEGQRLRVVGKVDKDLAARFKEFAADHKYFAFLVKVHSSKCEPGAKPDKGVHMMTIFYNSHFNNLEIYPEPRWGYFSKRWEFFGDSSMSDEIKEILREHAGMKLTANKWIEVPINFFYGSKTTSASEAFMLWCLAFAKERPQHASQTYGRFSQWLEKRATGFNLHMLYKAYEGFVDKYTKGKCSSKQVYNSESGKCITKGAARKYLALQPKKSSEINALLDMSFDHKLHKRNPRPNYNEWIAYFRLKYPVMDSIMPAVDYEEIPLVQWDQDESGKWFLHVDEEVEEALDQFFEKPDKRFFVTPLLIVGKPSSHLNLLIYDKFLNEFELWEPHGYQYGGTHESLEQMYPALKKYIEEKSNEGLLPEDVALILPPDYCPVGDYFQRDEAGDLIKGGDMGMCATWAWWYIDTRLGNAFISRKAAIKLAVKQLKALPDLKMYIRKYKQSIDAQLAEIVALGQDDFEATLADSEKKWKEFITKNCSEWNKNKLKNPRTGRKISEKGKVWKYYNYVCL
jgi:hypothetical protein